VQIEGDTGTTSYVQSVEFINSNFGYSQYDVFLGSRWQGILFGQCNFGGNQAIFVAGSQIGTLVQFVVNNSIFFVRFDAIELNTAVTQPVAFGNNVIIVGKWSWRLLVRNRRQRNGDR
jgi:hypothetical protein